MATSVFRRPAMRWAVPAGVATVVVAAAVTVPLVAGADAELPERSAVQLLADLAGAEKVPFAGTVVQSADVGLPALPDVGAGGSGAESGAAAVMSLLSGSTTARIWYTDETTFRVALQDELTESDLIRDGSDVWFWNSEANAVSHLDATDLAAQHPDPSDLPAPAHSPSELADLALGAVGATTDVDVDGTATVAGRSAYELVVRPQVEGSLIGSVRLAVDSELSVPLRVQVYGTDGGEPAIEVGFTSVSFDEPDRSVYEFTPPEGATVTEVDPAELAGEHKNPELAGALLPTVVGEGWTSVVVLHDVDLDELAAGAGGDSEEAAALLDAVLDELEPVTGEFGTGVALQNELFSVLMLDDGRVLAGAVTLDVLEAAALDPAATAGAAVETAPATP